MTALYNMFYIRQLLSFYLFLSLVFHGFTYDVRKDDFYLLIYFSAESSESIFNEKFNFLPSLENFQPTNMCWLSFSFLVSLFRTY
jgi:hypothetical protein